MVSPQATQPDKPSHPTDWPQQRKDESVRITAADVPAEVRRQVLREFLADALVTQRAAAESERADRKTAEGTEGIRGERLFSFADLRVSNAVAVQQWIASMVSACSDNREFTGQVNR